MRDARFGSMFPLFNGMNGQMKASTGTGGIYLIAVEDFVVAQDLSDTVREAVPAAVIVTAPGCAAALAAVADQPHLALAFVEAGPDRVAKLRLDEAIRARGGRLVLLGGEAEDAWDSGAATGRLWPVLIRPFSSQAVRSLLRAVPQG